MFLSDEFLAQYPAQPEGMKEIGIFTAYRTYTRWLESEERRETWKEAVTRAVNYSMEQDLKHKKALGYPFNVQSLEAEAEVLFDNIFNTRQFLSGRTHWVGGADTEVANKFPLANFNCSFIEIVRWEDLSELFYLLLVGTGVGIRASKEGAKALGAIRNDVKLVHEKYKPVKKEERLEETTTKRLKNGYVKIYVGDSKEGWVDALKQVFTILTDEAYEDVHSIKVSYNSIRPRGEKLKTFGGTASGYEPLQDMFEGIFKVIRGEMDDFIDAPEVEVIGVEEDETGRAKGLVFNHGRVHLRPIHILDIANLIGNNVVVGGVRRTAEIFLADEDDFEVILAKYGINGIWDEEHHAKVMEKLIEVGQAQWAIKLDTLEKKDSTARPLFHRRMSNNSVAFTSKPSREMLNLMFTIMQAEGEPGFVNLESAGKRRPNAKGLNPCAEILLDSYGVCNLTTVNVRAFVIEGDDGVNTLDFSGLMQAQALSARAGIRMTLLDLELPHWNAVHKRDRLIGTSLTGWYDAMDLLGYSKEQEKQLLQLLEECVNDTVLQYATGLRIPLPLISTTVKPEGTLSQVAGGVSSGLHRSHSPYYKRRIRINSNDALVSVAKELGWEIHAEVGTAGFNDEESLKKSWVIAQAQTLVITFPVESGAKTTKDDISIDDQFDTYFMFQEYYTQHNSSNTITVKPGEWERAEEIVWDKWDDFIGVSFLSHNGGTYVLAPYEACSKEEYEALKASMKPFDVELLHKYEGAGLSEDVADADCATGACPVR